MPFEFNFTPAVLNDCINNTNSAEWFQSVNDVLLKYDIISKLRFAAWIAQTGHESQDFKTLEENLNYRAAGLLSVFPSHFNEAESDSYEHQPEKIANRVYANRLGNGNEASGDGWKFHGRGLIQITGKTNYQTCSMSIYGDQRLLTNPELLIAIDGAVRSSCWFWEANNLNFLADKSFFETLTSRINGGNAGLADRIERYQHALSVLKNVGPALAVSTPRIVSVLGVPPVTIVAQAQSVSTPISPVVETPVSLVPPTPAPSFIDAIRAWFG